MGSCAIEGVTGIARRDYLGRLYPSCSNAAGITQQKLVVLSPNTDLAWLILRKPQKLRSRRISEGEDGVKRG